MTPQRWSALARHDAVVVLNSWDYWVSPLLRRANPHIQVWVYKDLSGVRSDDCATPGGQCGNCPAGVTDRAYLSSGMGYCWVRRHHPDWLLRAASSSAPLRFRGYPDTWETDYGNPAYQRQWTTNVLADVRAHRWDGVAIDNALTVADTYGLTARYRTDATVQAATYAALREAGRVLGRAHVRCVANVGYATRFPGLWQRWLGPLGGLEQEFFLSYTAAPNAVGRAWGSYENEVSACAAARKVCWFLTGGHTTEPLPRTRGYALASLLLASDGRQLLAAGDPASPPLRPGWALGRAAGPMDPAGRVWQREFAGGVAVVNPTTTPAVARLGGDFLDGAGRTVSAVRVGPASGAVLRRAPRAGAG
jgi:hypothetical protein